MLRNTLKIIVCALTLFAVHACEDRLEIQSPNDLSAEQFFKTPEQAVASVDAIYNVLIIDGAFNRMTPAYNDGRSDGLSSRSPWPLLTGLSQFVVPATDGAVGWAWDAYYIMVLRANQALENVPTVPDLDPELQDRLLAQAYFFRAFAYFQLTNIYDIVPLILSVPEGQEAFYPTNDGVTKDMIWDQIQADLDLAIASLPVSYDNVTGPDNGQLGRITKGAGLSLLGKMNLYRGEHAVAATYFKQVIDLGVYSLAANYADLFTDVPAIEQANPGKIFWAEFTTSTNADLNWGGNPTPNWRQFLAVSPTYAAPGFGFFDFFPTPFLYNEMRQELTNDNQLDPRYHATILSYEPAEGYTTAYGQDWLTGAGYQPGDYFIKKYTNADNGVPNEGAFTSGINYHIIRYADVLLMYAECLANTGNIAGAAQYVQQVRDRANLPDRRAEFAGYSLQQFMDQLAHERIMELSIEGLRFQDIRRWGWLDDAAKITELQSHDADFNTYTSGRKWMPIAQGELDLNPNLVGNSANQ
ncbi:RagB/SusD family nutrient uptake outer membrane protein [Marinoscillum sp.]|uniref:RagB/SusD family nutrient uptake outer membrane protein n=1 Tax=Marinoscillum sp. TaxID=2024838 RepID=UPI003BABE5EC